MNLSDVTRMFRNCATLFTYRGLYQLGCQRGYSIVMGVSDTKINKLKCTKTSKELEMNYNWSDQLTHTHCGQISGSRELGSSWLMSRCFVALQMIGMVILFRTVPRSKLKLSSISLFPLRFKTAKTWEEKNRMRRIIQCKEINLYKAAVVLRCNKIRNRTELLHHEILCRNAYVSDKK
jgi:hypothetical protein